MSAIVIPAFSSTFAVDCTGPSGVVRLGAHQRLADDAGPRGQAQAFALASSIHGTAARAVGDLRQVPAVCMAPSILA